MKYKLLISAVFVLASLIYPLLQSLALTPQLSSDSYEVQDISIGLGGAFKQGGLYARVHIGRTTGHQVLTSDQFRSKPGVISMGSTSLVFSDAFSNEQ